MNGTTTAGPAERIPPQNLEAEMAVIGAMLVDRSMIELVSEIVQPQDFYALIHETMAETIFALHAEGKPVDKLTLATALRDAGRPLEQFGGLPYLSRLLDELPTAASATYYATLVAEKARLRRLIVAALDIQRIAFAGEEDVDMACADADRTLREALEGGRRPSGGTTIQEGVAQAYRDLEAAVTGTSMGKAIMTPWPTVNTRVGGFFPGEMCVIAAAPAMGKTGLVLTLADYIAERYGQVAFFSLEMTPDAIHRRWLALHSEVTARNQRLGIVREHQWERLGAAMSDMSTRRASTYGRKAGTIDAMRRELSALRRRSGAIKAVVIDHVGFIADTGPRGQRLTENDRLDHIYRRILDLAEEFETTVFAVQHVSRAGMGQRPTMKDIRNGGNPEGHAHSILFPYREDPLGETQEARTKGEIICAKTRDGEEGIVPVRFYGYRHLWVEGDGQPNWLKSAPRYDEPEQPEGY